MPLTSEVISTSSLEKVFSIEGKEGEIGISGVEAAGDYNYTVTLAGELDSAKSYKISLPGRHPGAVDVGSHLHFLRQVVHIAFARLIELQGDGLRRVIYELHVRDLSVDENSGITNKGKFLGLTETGTKTPGGVSTGLDHIKDLGVTHLHLLPVYDFGSVDETHTVGNLFNWGYDPVNYNVPEGSYSTTSG